MLHFLAGIGDVCNDKLGTPYKRCNQLFDEARDDCREQLSVFAFLCYIVDGFKPLCHLAKGLFLNNEYPSPPASKESKHLLDLGLLLV